jgi:hypothetical protein
LLRILCDTAQESIARARRQRLLLYTQRNQGKIPRCRGQFRTADLTLRNMRLHRSRLLGRQCLQGMQSEIFLGNVSAVGHP